MKFILLFLALLLSFSCHLEAQSYLTPRIGNEIDIDEKVYFGLFPFVNGFVSAKVTSQNEDSTHFSIRSANRGAVRDSIFLIDTRTIIKLSKYIDNFESVRMKEKEVNWSVFKGVVEEVPSIYSEFRHPLRATITALNGTNITGDLLWTDDSTLVLWKIDTCFNWRDVSYNASAIKVRSVSKISIEQSGGFEKGIIYGAWTGLGLSLVYAAVNYKDVFGLNTGRTKINIGFYLFPAVIAASSFVGGIIGTTLLPDYQANIDGDEEKYRLNQKKLAKSSIIESYPPPEIIHLIESSDR